MKRATSVGLAVALGLAAMTVATPASAATGAVLRGLDKRTGQARDFVAPIGRTVKFGTLEITARACQKAAPEETPEVSVFIEVSDKPIPRTKDEQTAPRQLLSGWIFASSPALNALEHPIYDVWAIDCRS